MPNPPLPPFLAAFDAATERDAEAELLACCASARWAAEVAARRPYHDLDTLVRVSDAALAALDWADVRQAVNAHPRIGERATGYGREAAWSRAEQSAATGGDTAAAGSPPAATAAALAAGNSEYERRFDQVFLICATGLSADRILAALRERLGNDEATERQVVREELRKIVALRLAKLAGAEPGGPHPGIRAETPSRRTVL